MKPASLAEEFFFIGKAEPFSIKEWPCFYAPYNTPYNSMLMMCSRQVGKSLTLANKSLGNVCRSEFGLIWVSGQSLSHQQLKELKIRAHRVLNVTPTKDQASFFSEQKINQILAHSPIFSLFTNNKTTDRVLFKSFVNGSNIFLASCYHSPDSIRGYTSDQINIDELQDIMVDFLPIIYETQNRSINKSRILSGTPKTTQNAINHVWHESRMCEWVIECTGCNKWQNLIEENIGLTGPICRKCGKSLANELGQWAAMNPGAAMDGYRIHSLMANFYPWTGPKGSNQYKESLIYKYENYGKAQFYNEVLALPMDAGTRPTTTDQIKANCQEGERKRLKLESGWEPASKKPGNRMIVAAGVDWGSSEEGKSKTVLTITGYVKKKFAVLFAKKYGSNENNVEYQIKDIIKHCNRYEVDIIGGDKGFGHGKNSKLAKAFGEEMVRGRSNKVIEFNNNEQLKARRKFSEEGLFYSLNRTEVQDDIFENINGGNFSFPVWEVFRECAEDILHIAKEYNESLRKIVYTHAPNEPDDFMWSLIYSIEPILIIKDLSCIC